MDSVLFATAPEPTFDAAYFLALLSRLAHTSCGAVLLGGLIYLRCVVSPHADGADDPGQAMYAGRRKSWAMCVAIASLLLLVSGFYNLWLFMQTYDNLPKLYHPLFGVKFLLGVGVMAIAALLAGKTKLAQRLQRSSSLWLNLAIAMAVTVFLLGAMLRSFRDLPGARSLPPQAAADAAESTTTD